ncbi:hypothetical protein D3C71_2151260 [compost metagenome]
MGNVKFTDTDKRKTVGELQSKVEHKTLVLWAVDALSGYSRFLKRDIRMIHVARTCRSRSYLRCQSYNL